MQLLSKYNKGIKYLLCAIDLFSKYAWVIPIKDKKRTSIVNAFQKILSNSNRKLNKIWADQGSKFYNNSFKDVLKINNIEMSSTYNEEKSAVAENFIRTLENKIFKHMTAISENVYLDVLDDIAEKYNNTVHKTIKLKPIDVTDNTYIDFKKEVKDKDPKFQVGDRVRIQNIKTFLVKDTLQIAQKKFLLLLKLKMKFLGLMLLMI